MNVHVYVLITLCEIKFKLKHTFVHHFKARLVITFLFNVYNSTYFLQHNTAILEATIDRLSALVLFYHFPTLELNLVKDVTQYSHKIISSIPERKYIKIVLFFTTEYTRNYKDDLCCY